MPMLQLIYQYLADADEAADLSMFIFICMNLSNMTIFMQIELHINIQAVNLW